ncbi:YqjF family protein [Rathayibacter sp. VKM Ac-2928]|uniref:YqjF family protein n=1 Tax=Rathayibacter sp. VKM Ac-2928 TaxID=2929479 RepID=UPI001FB40B28|nr:DUF2071 domain-containing protein [Rathayibacter sp. VKM Ac-2928]MCJ1681773.1 DUF2071 domain-containing protein [Rathayibacter sp. VKM Ac-2928]
MTSVESVTRSAPALGGPRILRQRWTEAAFLHWRVDPALVAPHLPPGVRPDEHDGASWVGLIPFRLSRTAFLGGPRVPWLGTFPEVNVRLYSIDRHGGRGVVFVSLEASHLLPVLTAQAVFGLPYRWARMGIEHRHGAVIYTTERIGDPAARSRIVVRPTPGTDASEDPIGGFLTSRWAYHERHLGSTWYGRNRHRPWPLQRAELLALDDGLLEVAGFPGLATRTPDSVLYSPGVETVFTVPRRV